MAQAEEVSPSSPRVDLSLIGELGLFLGGAGVFVLSVAYLTSVRKRYSYREWRRDKEWHLATFEATRKLRAHPGGAQKIIESYREALTRLDALELEMRALEGPEPNPPSVGFPKRD